MKTGRELEEISPSFFSLLLPPLSFFSPFLPFSSSCPPLLFPLSLPPFLKYMGDTRAKEKYINKCKRGDNCRSDIPENVRAKFSEQVSVKEQGWFDPL